jgi:hypothetical protein
MVITSAGPGRRPMLMVLSPAVRMLDVLNGEKATLYVLS